MKVAQVAAVRRTAATAAPHFKTNFDQLVGHSDFTPHMTIIATSKDNSCPGA